MFDRAALKSKAKKAFKRYYWKCVFIALILMLFTGGTSRGSSSNNNNTNNDFDSSYSYSTNTVDDYLNNLGIDFYDESGNLIGTQVPSQVTNGITSVLGSVFSNLPVGMLAFMISFGLIIAAAAIVVSIFILSMIEIGGCRFFLRTSRAYADDTEPQLGDLFYGFSNGNYMTNVMTQFFRSLFTFLWSLLFIIPGIIKSYEYCMIPYLLADHPDMTREDAFAISKEMMTGNKMAAFVLDLSFIGWDILSAFTFGLAGIFYVNPYRYATKAELYEALK